VDKYVECITRMAVGVGRAFIPPVRSQDVTGVWQETEWRVAQGDAKCFYGGSWAGESGQLALEWTFDEFCFITSGRVALVDRRGGRVEFVAGDAFHVPRGFIGEWLTLEPSTKHFIIVE
jgi:uncharacterized protein